MSLAGHANRRRNRRAPADRAVRWRHARDELWCVLDPLVAGGARVAVVGAGNGDDVPLARQPRRVRAKLTAVEEDVTAGVAERVAAAIVAGHAVRDDLVPRSPVGTGGYDVVVADLLYTQLLFPALLDAEVEPERRTPALQRHGQRLTDGVVRRLHASSRGHVVHVHDVAGWWPGHPQPLTPAEVLAPAPGPAALVHRLGRPAGCDVRGSVARTKDPVTSERWWTWPFAADTTYLVRGIVARVRR